MALLFSTTRIPYLKFLYTLLLLMMGHAIFYTLIPAYPLKPIIWLFIIELVLFYPTIRIPLSPFAATPTFFRIMALHRYFLYERQTIPLPLLF
jgi:hypothetical protein